MSSPTSEPVINSNPSLQKYYASLESRIGYKLLLGGTRHFGYYERSTSWPFLISRALRAMEDHLFKTLSLEKGAFVLDAGCGVGHVAIHLARKGLRVQGIDVIDRSIEEANRNIKAEALESAVAVQKMDYHHLDGFEVNKFDGVYTMETFVHATDPEGALKKNFRVLKPGGKVTFYEYDNIIPSSATLKSKDAMDKINMYASMPSNARFEDGVLQRMLEEAGFEDVVVQDLTENVTPMLRLFFILAYIPYIFVKLFGWQSKFVNTMAGVEGYQGREFWRYVAVSAKKPAAASGTWDSLCQRKNS